MKRWYTEWLAHAFVSGLLLLAAETAGGGESVIQPDKPGEAAALRALPASSGLHPESTDTDPLVLIPESVHVIPGWNSLVLSTAPTWSASVRGPGIARGEVGITIKAVPPGWNLYDKLWVALDIENKGIGEVLVRGGLRHPLGPVGAEVVKPGETRTLAVLIIRELAKKHDYLAGAFRGVHGLPGGHFAFWRNVNAASVMEFKLHVSSTETDIDLELGALRGVVDFAPPTKEQVAAVKEFSMIDRFGQNRFESWPGKISRAAELLDHIAREDDELAHHPRPASWNRFGGWEDGPQLEATGHFRTEKHDGFWWLVDPEGRLFWSFGINCVIAEDRHGILRTTTPGLWKELNGTPEGEPGPKELPGIEEEDRWHPYMANLSRKYGTTWQADAVVRAHRRLESWGVNTLGNWSGPEVAAAGRTPYVREVHFGRPSLQYGRTYYQASLPDVFDPGFGSALRKKMAEVAATTADDPWCIGYFVDNELPFQSLRQIGESIVTAAATTYAKKALVTWLQERYPSLDDLNVAWGSAIKSWDEVAQQSWWREGDAFAADARAFAAIYLDRYYLTCREVIKEAAPNKLYLGSRLHHYFPEVFEACAKHADVVSINFYDFSPVALPLLRIFEGDKPFIIGEFHFGTLTEQGVWGPGLAQTKDLEHSGRLLQRFIRDCLTDPRIVGAHWFQYVDQPVTGRGDGENFRVGFVNIADVPHPALIRASRQVGADMYHQRRATSSEGHK